MIFAARSTVAETTRFPGQFDFVGALTSTFGMSALVYGIVHSAEAGWTASSTVGPLAIGAVLIALFILNEWHAPQPIMPLRLFASRERSGAYAARVLFLGANIGFFFFSTQFLQSVIGLSPALTGLAFLPAMVVNFLTAMALPRLISRLGNGRVLGASIAISMIGMLWLSRASIGTSYLEGLALPMLLIGIGQGGSLGPLTTFGIAGVAAKDAGAASGLINTAHQLGSSLGLGVLMAVSVLGGGVLDGPALLAHRVQNAMAAAAAMLALALLLVFALVVRQRRVVSQGGPSSLDTEVVQISSQD
jgi:predicted MFS family arabinose efflux permease